MILVICSFFLVCAEVNPLAIFFVIQDLPLVYVAVKVGNLGVLATTQINSIHQITILRQIVRTGLSCSVKAPISIRTTGLVAISHLRFGQILAFEKAGLI